MTGNFRILAKALIWIPICPKCNKDEWGALNCRVSPDQIMQPRQDRGHGNVFCLIRGTIRDPGNGMCRVGNVLCNAIAADAILAVTYG